MKRRRSRVPRAAWWAEREGSLLSPVAEIQKIEASRMASSGRSSQVSSRSGAEGSR